MTELRHFFASISKIRLFGSYPINGLLHFLVGMLTTVLLLRFTNLKRRWIFAILLLACLVKEYIDYYKLSTASMWDPLWDILLSLSYFFIVVLIREGKKRFKSSVCDR